MSVLVERDHIGIFGRMNAGKSSLMNLLTQQQTSIVDAAPGTTADTKIALQEIHGMGPVKVFDTAGADEEGPLGDKKRQKVFADLKECDLVLIVVRPSSGDSWAPEKAILERARDMEKQILVIYNLFAPEEADHIPRVEAALPLLRFVKKTALNAADPAARLPLLDFILTHFDSKNRPQPLFPFLERDAFYLLVIPMDEETPPGRYLRPQAMAEEYITRHWAWPVSFRLDLVRARSAEARIREEERLRFLSVIDGLGRRPRAVITDSQAMDVLHRWCPSDIPLTTFSITMIQYGSRGRLAAFAAGLRTLESLQAGDRVLIAEACNHSRIAEDIGTVQIPKYLEKRCPGVRIEHSFGKAFSEQEDLTGFKLIIHCGGCMISPQKLGARLRDLESLGIPFTNYGLVLSWLQGLEALRRVLAPWGVEPPAGL